MRRILILCLCFSLLSLVSACKTGSAGVSLLTASTFSFNGQTYQNLNVIASGTKPYVVTASPISTSITNITLTFSHGNPTNGSYSATPTESNACTIAFSSNTNGVQNYVSVMGSVSVTTTNEGKRVASFTNVNLVNSSNPVDIKQISGSVIF